MKVNIQVGDNFMEFKKEDINHVLEVSALITKKDSPFPSFSNISFFPDGIAAMNEISFLFHKTDTQTDRKFGVAPELFKIINNNKENDLTLKLGKKFLSVTSKSVKARLSYTEEIEKDNIPEIPKKFKDLPINFVEALGKAKFASSKDEKNPEKYCFFVQKDNVFTTNNQMVAKAEFDEEVDGMMFPVEFFPVLKLFAPTKYFVSEGWVFFNLGDSTIGVRQIEPTELSEKIAEQFNKIENEKVDLPEGFKSIIEESGIFIDSDMGIDSISFKFRKGEMILSSDNAKGEIKKSVPFETKMDSFILSQKYLKAVAPISDYFCNEDSFVVFFGNQIITMVYKIQ